MLTIESAIRLMVMGQEFLIIAVFLFSRSAGAARFAGALLMLSVIGYLFVSDGHFRELAPPLLPLMTFLALIVPYCVWLFARAVFEAAWPRLPIAVAAVAIVVSVWGMNLAGLPQNLIVDVAAGITMRVVALMIVAHAVWIAVRGRPDDLIEDRRTFRLIFVAIISVQVTAVLVVELVLGETLPPTWLSLTNVIIIALVTIGLSIPLLRLNSDFFQQGITRTPQGVESNVGEFGPASGVYRKKLLELMASGYYRETGLTISALATKIDYPEHQLRKLINGHLGYRNFSAFLNSYRIDAARAELANPERARTPILSIALELGYASLGPFNRAFKDATEMTPSNYRRQELGAIFAESE